MSRKAQSNAPCYRGLYAMLIYERRLSWSKPSCVQSAVGLADELAIGIAGKLELGNYSVLAATSGLGSPQSRARSAPS